MVPVQHNGTPCSAGASPGGAPESAPGTRCAAAAGDGPSKLCYPVELERSVQSDLGMQTLKGRRRQTKGSSLSGMEMTMRMGVL